MSKSRKWVTSLLVAASMAVVGTASALDDALVASMTTEIVAALQNVQPNATEDQRADAIKAALASKSEFSGKLDEIIQAIADAKVADTVATKVILSAAPTMTADQVSNSFAAAKIVTETKSSSGATNPVTASGGQPQSGTPVVQQSQQAGGTSGGSGSGTSFSGAPSSVGGGTGVSRT